MLKLNLGSGRMQLAGYVAVDIDPKQHPDVVADVLHLPYEDDSVDEIFAAHILEHTARSDHALEEWLRVLRPGGVLYVCVPDANEIVRMWKHGMRWGPYHLPVDESYIDASVFGAHMLEGVPELELGELGHTHKSFYIQDMLVQALLKAGYANVTEVALSPVRESGWGETMARGYKPEKE